MREAWKRETYVRSKSFSSESAVKYLHVGRRKIQTSPPLGEQDQSNALPQGQQRQSNPNPMPCLFPRRLYIDRCITVENSPNASSVYIRLCKHRKKFFYCFYKITFPRKKRKTLCLTLIKREILTSRKILSTKSCTRIQFLFCKKMLCKIRSFLA